MGKRRKTRAGVPVEGGPVFAGTWEHTRDHGPPDAPAKRHPFVTLPSLTRLNFPALVVALQSQFEA
jgi:hypothetical protein